MVPTRVRPPTTLLAAGAIAAALLAGAAPARADDVFGRIAGWWEQGPKAEALCVPGGRQPVRVQVTEQRRQLVADRSLLPPELAGAVPATGSDAVLEVEGSGWNRLVLRPPSAGERDARWELVMVRPDVLRTSPTT